MRSGFLWGLLLLLAVSSSGQGNSGAFARDLPAAVGDISEWETITGDFETTAARGSYLFYVNPRRQAMYQLMRYRVELLDAGSARKHGSAERVAFVRRPESREPLMCLRPGSGSLPSTERPSCPTLRSAVVAGPAYGTHEHAARDAPIP